MKQYLGDSVYAEFDGDGIVLTTENGFGGPSNKIYLEPEILANLNLFVDKCYEFAVQRADKK